MTSRDAEIEHVPDKTAPHKRMRLDGCPILLMNNCLPSFRMPLAIGFGLMRRVLMLAGVCTSTIFAHAKTAVPAVVTMRVQPGAKFGQRIFAAIPSRIGIPAQQIGNLVHLRKF